ncbi:MAG TPA: serine hydrolase domain-containing protein [Caulobacteraceae bacterium]|jgi:CubicO group peptidase (beta-lactamase class C family)
MIKRRAKWLGLVAGALALVWAGAPAAQPDITPGLPVHAATQPNMTLSTLPAAHPLTADDVQTFLDGMMPTALKSAEIPGAVVVVVKDGQVLFEKGYGFADAKAGTPVDPKTTLFRPGSVSKLFTWTAVMQQVEAGKIDLDASVNRYLDFKIPAYHGAPVTMRELMTHRAGFSETARDLLSFGKAPPPLETVLKRYVPPRIFAPDEGPGYSNYGASLAGYIVQRVSGEKFEDYVERHIFAPLGMSRSTFVQPLPGALSPDMSVGYKMSGEPGDGFEIISMPPAGSLSSTGDDMAKFMIAQLQNGSYNGAQILTAPTAVAMHTTAWHDFPDLNGNLLGFYQQNINGHRVIAHGGDTDYFHSDLSLFIDDNVGLYVSLNSVGKGGLSEFLRQQMFEAFADRYFPAAAVAAAPTVSTATAKAHAALIAGPWMTTRRSDSTFLSIIKLISPTMVTANKDGTISVSPIIFKETFTEVSPFLWQEVHGHDRLEARVKDGKVVAWGTDASSPIWVYVRPNEILAAMGLAIPVGCAAFGFLILTAFSWPWAAIARRRYGASFAYQGARSAAYRLVRIGAVLSIVAVGLWLAVVQMVSSTAGAPVAFWLHLAQAISFLAFVGGALAALWNLWIVWRNKSPGTARLFAILLLLAFVVMLKIAFSYHLIGLSGEY